MLTVKQDASRVQKPRHQRRRKRDKQRDDDEIIDGDDQEWRWNRPWEVSWSNIPTTGIPAGHDEDENSPERDFLSRAYHTSTLLLNRYLVVIGGMKCMWILFIH